MTGGVARAAAHFFVADLDRPALDPDDRHHAARVLRLRGGDVVTVGDGEGRWRHCRFGDELTPDGDVVVEPRPSPPIAVGFALVKGERPEWITQKLTELGVDEIVPFTASRSVVRWDAARAERSVVRLRRVAREAAMQSRAAWLPSVTPLVDFPAVSARPGAALADLGDGEPPSLRHRLVLVGPEGGWDDDERAAGLPRVRLGANVLRAETAAVAAGAIWTALRAGLVAAACGDTP